MRFTSFTLAAAVACLLPLAAEAFDPPPAAPVRPVTDNYFGTTIIDPYRWMETADDPELASWMKEQDSFTRAALQRIPGRELLLREIIQSFRGTEVTGLQVAADRRFFIRTVDGGSTQLYQSKGSATTLLFDPQQDVSAGSHAAIEYFSPSSTGKYVAVGVALNGAERDTTIRIIEAASGHDLGERITRAWGASPIWNGNGGFFYSRLPKSLPGADPAEAEQRMQVFFHRLGQDPDSERPVFGFGVESRIAATDESYVFTSAGSKYAIGVVQRGVANQSRIYAADLSVALGAHAAWRFLGEAFVDPGGGSLDLPGFVDLALRGDGLYSIRFDGMHRTEVTRTNLRRRETFESSVVVLAPGDRVDRGLSAASDGVYVWSMSAGLSQLARLDTATNAARSIALPALGTLTEPAADPTRPGVVFGLTSWTRPLQYYAYDPASGLAIETSIASIPEGGVSRVLQADEVMVTSKDGTQVPLSILHRTDIVLDGSHPTIIIGYGSYGASLEAGYAGTARPWIERGGVLAVAHVRGGGEFGEPWHLAGKDAQKQHTIDDFLACAEYLGARGYTSRGKLAGIGASAGGITIGNAIVQRAELFIAANIRVGITNLLRYENTANGIENIAEFGSVTTAAGFRNLYAVSAYDHIVAGTPYPATLVETGINDPRVPPWMSAEMAARLQAASSSGKPVLLRVDYVGGHGVDMTGEQQAEHQADVESFFLWQLGEPGFEPAVNP